MKKMKVFCALALCFSILCSFDVVSAHHHGGTNSYSGHHGHHDGEGVHYYCDGHSAHLHPDGVCPYSSARHGNSECYRVSTVKKVQKKLNKLGYHCGQPDGACGSQTRKAIRLFQRKNGMSVNGEINRALLKKLKIKK